jgi:hypothetical protein
VIDVVVVVIILVAFQPKTDRPEGGGKKEGMC